MLQYGQSLPSLLSYVLGTAKVQSVQESLIQQEKVLEMFKERLLTTQNRIKIIYDKTHLEGQFQVGGLGVSQALTISTRVHRYKSLPKASNSILQSI